MKEHISYNLWHGCIKKSEGCQNCYVYRNDLRYEKDPSVVYKTKAFYLPLMKNRKGEYKYPSGTVFDMCFTSDFFLKEADVFRKEALAIIKERQDCTFFCITKRPERILECLKTVEEYPNLIVYCTMENEKRFLERAPIYLSLPLKVKGIVVEPCLERIDFDRVPGIERVDVISIGGESGEDARVLDFRWVEDMRKQCQKKKIPFVFRQTGSYLKKDGRIYHIARKHQFSQAKKAFPEKDKSEDNSK